MKKYLIPLTIWTVALVIINIAGTFDIIAENCESWKKVGSLFLLFACTNGMGVAFVKYLRDIYKKTKISK